MKKLFTIALVLFSSIVFSQQLPSRNPDNLPSRNPKMLPSRAYQIRPQVIERKDGKVTIVITEQQFRMIQQKKPMYHLPKSPMCKKCSKYHKHS
jgi:hypothetical protein